MTIITFLGMIGGRIDKDGHVKLGDTLTLADYRIAPYLRNTFRNPSQPLRYPNMLPLLLDTFAEVDIIAIGTEGSHRLQRRMIETHYPHLSHRYEPLTIEDPHDYPAIFRMLSDILANHDRIIVDISHSFRHLPSLMMVDMIIENIKDPGKIQHILFAKELVPSEKYVIVDLREYLTLANVSYALASFTKNYTIATTVQTVEEIYQALLNELSLFSEHILANSIEALIHRNGDSLSIVERIIHNIALLKTHDTTKELIHPLIPALDTIVEHMQDILAQAKNARDERYFFFAETMFHKGYLLNALTMLNEALAAYCVEGFRRLPQTAKAVEAFDVAIVNNVSRSTYNHYEMSNIAKNIVKRGEKYFYNKHSSKTTDTEVAKNYAEALLAYTNSDMVLKKTRKLRALLYECDVTRNNLAHANSSDRIEKVRETIMNLLIRYERICHDDDPLHRFD